MHSEKKIANTTGMMERNERLMLDSNDDEIFQSEEAGS
jgi:hypothetical protein